MSLKTRTKRTSHHKKLSGRHHRRSDHYLKTYWPYLPMLLIVGLGFIVNNVWSSSAVLGASSDYSAEVLLADTNQQRVQSHESSLTLNRQLNDAAQAKANDMAKRNYWSHNTPDGKTPWSFITTAGYQYQAAGENLAYGFDNATDTVAGWMNSPSHRANILNANFQNVGFGVANSPNYQGQGPETIVVAEYGRPAEALPITASGGTAGAQDVKVTVTAKPVSRIQVLTSGRASWSKLAVSALAGIAGGLFIASHALRLRRLIMEGESFVLHHPILDIAVVFVGTAAVILIQASGTIR